MRTGQIHYARLDKSPRLQRALAVLQDAGERGLTTLEIIQRTGLCAINSTVCELRKNGYNVYCRNEGKTSDGATVFRYKLVAP